MITVKTIKFVVTSNHVKPTVYVMYMVYVNGMVVGKVEMTISEVKTAIANGFTVKKIF